jgi:hypothetical protein
MSILQKPPLPKEQSNYANFAKTYVAQQLQPPTRLKPICSAQRKFLSQFFSTMWDFVL